MCLKSPRASSSSLVTDDEQNAIYRFEEMPCSPSIICKMADVVSVDGMGGEEIQENARVTMTTISTGVVVSQSQPQPKPLPLVRWLGKRHTTMK